MMYTLFVVGFWVGLALSSVGAIASYIAWFRHRRRGERIKTAEALLGIILSLLCFVALWSVHELFIIQCCQPAR